MRIIHGWRGLPEADRGAAVAFGNFDGVHLGHQQVIAQARDAARRLEAPLGVASLEPHPRKIFRPNEPAFRLMTIDQQARALAALGVERFYLLPFDFEMANFTAWAFAQKVLAEGLGARHVAVGFDNSFGRDRTGTPDELADYGQTLGFSVSVAEPVADHGEKLSSTLVREALREGRPEAAAAMMGRPFAIEGVVRRGQQLGRTLGIPTANVFLEDYVAPKLGVYATVTRLPDGRRQPGVANIGQNPTTGLVAARLEVWLFDFAEDLYGQVIETELIAFLRPEEKFDGVAAMLEQIGRDAAAARAILGTGQAPDAGERR
jgi:riboflavin kinase / FMN adenylyltransferase